MIRCLPVGNFGGGALVEIPCGELVDDGTCIETPIGGEFPGPACSSPARRCTNSFAAGFSCGDDGALTLCLYGEVIEIQCQDYGYADCEEGQFFDTRCVN